MDPILKRASNPESRIRIRPILVSTGELTTEILRLLALYPHDRETFRILGLEQEDVAARIVERLPGPGAALFAADDGKRLRGIIYLQPDLWPSAALGKRMWTIQQLIVEPGAPEEVARSLIKVAIESLGDLCEFVQISVPEKDTTVVKGLTQSGFKALGRELVAVANPRVEEVPEMSGIDVNPLEEAQLDSLAEMTGKCQACNPFASHPEFEPGRVALLSQRMHANCLREADCQTLVAINQERQVLGTVRCSQETEWEGDSTRKLSRVDGLCVRPGAPSGLARFLNQKVLADLGRQSVDAVTARILQCSQQAEDEPDWLAPAGYTVTSRNLLMQKWLGDKMVRPGLERGRKHGPER